MRKDVTVSAQVRDTRGKNEARRTRVAGNIPAVLYGAGKDPVSIAVSPKEVLAIVKSTTGYNTIFNLAIAGGETTPVMVVDHKNDPIKYTLLHADFKRVDLTKRIRVTIPVLVTGEPKGVKLQGGHLEIVNRSVEVECLPDEIPESFIFDVVEMMVGNAKRASDVPLKGSMKLVSPPDAVLAHVISVKAEVVAADAAAPVAAVAEPEVVKKGKKEEEEKKDDKKKK